LRLLLFAVAAFAGGGLAGEKLPAVDAKPVLGVGATAQGGHSIAVFPCRVKGGAAPDAQSAGLSLRFVHHCSPEKAPSDQKAKPEEETTIR